MLHEFETAIFLFTYLQLPCLLPRGRRCVGGVPPGPGVLLSPGGHRGRGVPRGELPLRGAQRHAGGPGGPQADPGPLRAVRDALRPDYGLQPGLFRGVSVHGLPGPDVQPVLWHPGGPDLRQLEGLGPGGQLLKAQRLAHGIGPGGLLPQQFAGGRGGPAGLLPRLPHHRRLLGGVRLRRFGAGGAPGHRGPAPADGASLRPAGPAVSRPPAGELGLFPPQPPGCLQDPGLRRGGHARLPHLYVPAAALAGHRPA